MSDTDNPACANCGAALAGRYCAVCGQSREALLRPAFDLVGQILSDAFDLDGRLWRTLRRLYVRPGSVARDFVEGKRQSFTPPVRLYVFASLFFLGLVAFAGVRVVAVEFVSVAGAETDAQPAGADDLNDFNLAITLFGLGEPPAPIDVGPEDIAAVRDGGGAVSMGDRIFARAISDPAGLERAAATAVNVALIAMVALYAVWNALLHPRRRLIEHVVHATYFHAGLYPVVAASLGARRFVGDAAPLAVTIFLALATGIWFLFWIVASDRGFYRTSVVGLILRAPLLIVGYIIAVIVTSLGLVGFALH